MLEKMGWKKGEGLGKDGGGMKTPVRLAFSFFILEQVCLSCTSYVPGTALRAGSIVPSKSRCDYWLSGIYDYQIYICELFDFDFNIFRKPPKSFSGAKIVSVISWVKVFLYLLVVFDDFLILSIAGAVTLLLYK